MIIEKEKRFMTWWGFFLNNTTYPENYSNNRDLELAKYFYEKGTEFTTKSEMKE